MELFCLFIGYPTAYPAAAPAYNPSLYPTNSPSYAPGKEKVKTAVVSGVGGEALFGKKKPETLAGLSMSLIALGSACPRLIVQGVPSGNWDSSASGNRISSILLGT